LRADRGLRLVQTEAGAAAGQLMPAAVG
jgi:hypothetical protein